MIKSIIGIVGKELNSRKVFVGGWLQGNWQFSSAINMFGCWPLFGNMQVPNLSSTNHQYLAGIGYDDNSEKYFEYLSDSFDRSKSNSKSKVRVQLQEKYLLFSTIS